MANPIRIYLGGIYANDKGDTVAITEISSSCKNGLVTFDTTRSSPRRVGRVTLDTGMTEESSLPRASVRDLLRRGKFRFVEIAGPYRRDR